MCIRCRVCYEAQNADCYIFSTACYIVACRERALGGRFRQPQDHDVGVARLIDKVIARDGEGRRHSRETKSGREPNEPRRGRPKVERIRKKYGAHPFARLSLASTRCLIEGAAGRFAGCRKKDRGRWKEEAEPEGRQLSRLPEVQPLSPSPNWRLRRYARLGRFFEMPSRLNRYAPAISHPPLLPEAPLRRQGQRTSGQSEVDAFSGTTFR